MLDKDELIELIENEYGSIEDAFYENTQEGICYNCGYIQSNVEPDACECLCENCESYAIFGIEEAILTLVG